MSEWDYSWDYGGSAPYDAWSWDAGATPSPSAWDTFTGWGDNATQWGADYDPSLYEGEAGAGGGGGWLQTVLGGLGNVGSFLGKNAGTLGPLLSGAGSIAGGAIGSNAANEAARLQAAAANRGIDLQTSQWLQQQQNLAPYLQAGQQGLSQLQQLAGREQPALPGGMASIDPNAYGMPGATPTWAPAQYRGPGAVQSGDYRWNPQQGPQAQDYRYTPGAVPTLSGQELLANDPGVAFRLAEGRKALEASAAAKGGLLSGPTLAALQRSGQELSARSTQTPGTAPVSKRNCASSGTRRPRRWGGRRPRVRPGSGKPWPRRPVPRIGHRRCRGRGRSGRRAFRRSRTASASNSSLTRRITTDSWASATRLSAWIRRATRRITTASRTPTSSRWRSFSYRMSNRARLRTLVGRPLGCLASRARVPPMRLPICSISRERHRQGVRRTRPTRGKNALQNVNTGVQGGLQNQQYVQGLRSILAGLNA